jgi:hypothetical protein
VINCELSILPMPGVRLLGSARVPRAGKGVPPSRTLLLRSKENDALAGMKASKKVCFGETPKPARETRALPEGLRETL